MTENIEKKSTPLLRTPLYGWHIEQKAKMVPFAGYQMPVQYEGVLPEHNWTREHAGLFDVSHMGQAYLMGDWIALEKLVSADLQSLGTGEQKYALLLNSQGGILDDLMLSRPKNWAQTKSQGLFLVVNAATKSKDFSYIQEHLKGVAELEIMEDRALLALQGPKAHKVLAALAPEAVQQVFMESCQTEILGVPVFVSRSGYTGEDGFEISLPAMEAEKIANAFLESDSVKPIGLGARDSLRLEAGLCLYGHDMDEHRTPIEASLGWALPKVRRERADFLGSQRILAQLSEGVKQKRIGLRLKGRAPAREGAHILSEAGDRIGIITSGSYGPTVGGAIAMGYVNKPFSKIGTRVQLLVRNQPREAEIIKMPFVPHNFYRGEAIL